ncbi:MAG: phosphotransferase [Pseudomonadota bacterium]
MSKRLDLIRHWLFDELSLPKTSVELASSDASFRRYFRIETPEGRRIVMDAPPQHEDIRPFESIARQLATHGVHVPHVYASCAERGLMLLEDLGNTPYLARLSTESAEILYRDALATLLHIQSCPADELPRYGQGLLMREMHLFDEWFLQRQLGLHLTDDDRALLQDVYTQLAARAVAQPQAFVHRDFHSRNLMVTNDRSPGVIDFQDAVSGPITYDLVSLLRDSYIEWPEQRVQQWARDFHGLLITHGTQPPGWDQFWTDFNWISAQRHLKVAGIFARLNLRDGKSDYLKDIPLTLRNMHHAMRPYPEFSQFLIWLDERLADTDFVS